MIEAGLDRLDQITWVKAGQVGHGLVVEWPVVMMTYERDAVLLKSWPDKVRLLQFVTGCKWRLL